VHFIWIVVALLINHIAMRNIFVIAIVLLSACGSADDNSGPGGLPDSDAAALDAAASRLDDDSAIEADE
jgi:hypothetical protein